jgi:hypothetical protein
VATFISNKKKCHIFLLSFVIFLLQNWRTGWQNKSCPWRGLITVGGGGGREGGRRMNINQNCICMHVNPKMIPGETIPGIGEGEDKGA